MTTDDRTSSLATWGVRLPAAFIAAGALFKLTGSPNDIPPVVHEVVGDKILAYRLAIMVELAVAALALLRPRLGWPLVAATFVVFDVVLVQLVASGTASCGCFGGRVTIPPAAMLAIDTALLVGMLALRPWRAARQARVHVALVGAALVAALVAPWLVDREVTTPVANRGGESAANGGANGSGDGGSDDWGWADFEPDSWVGQPIADTQLANGFLDVLSLPMDGTWVFYRQGCSHCADHLEHLWQNPDPEWSPLSPLVLVRIVEQHDTPENSQIRMRPEGPFVIETQLAGGVEYLMTTPADLELEAGVVTAVRHPIETEAH